MKRLATETLMQGKAINKNANSLDDVVSHKTKLQWLRITTAQTFFIYKWKSFFRRCQCFAWDAALSLFQAVKERYKPTISKVTNASLFTNLDMFQRKMPIQFMKKLTKSSMLVNTSFLIIIILTTQERCSVPKLGEWYKVVWCSGSGQAVKMCWNMLTTTYFKSLNLPLLSQTMIHSVFEALLKRAEHIREY